MTARLLPNLPRDQRILVVSFLHNAEVLPKIARLANDHALTILNGGLILPSAPERHAQQVHAFVQAHANIGYCLSSDDLLFAEKNRKHTLTPWLNGQLNVFILEFANATRTIICHGGILPKMDRSELMDNLEVSFLSKIKGKSWHKSYGGRLGYVISNLPMKPREPEFHGFSCQMGSETGIYAQVVSGDGLGETIEII